MAGVMGIRKFAREQQPGKITERVYAPSPELVQLNDLSMSGFDPVMDLPRVIELAQEVERPRVAAAPAGEPLAPQRPSTPRELTITASRAAPVEQAPENLSRALWEIYNRTENPVDFVRADEAMMRGERQTGGEVEKDYADRIGNLLAQASSEPYREMRLPDLKSDNIERRDLMRRRWNQLAIEALEDRYGRMTPPSMTPSFRMQTSVVPPSEAASVGATPVDPLSFDKMLTTTNQYPARGTYAHAPGKSLDPQEASEYLRARESIFSSTPRADLSMTTPRQIDPLEYRFADGGIVDHAMRVARQVGGGFETVFTTPQEQNAQLNDAIMYARQLEKREAMKEAREALAETWPARLARDVYSAVQLPGDVYMGRVDPRSDESIKRALDLAGTTMSSTAFSAPSGAVLGAGPRVITRPTEVNAAPTREPLFDYSSLGNVPHVRQFDLPRYEPARGVPERTQTVINDPTVREQMLRTIEEGEKLGGSRWYNADPLRDVFVREHGRERGDEAFRKYMDFVAATSPRSEVGSNARNASYYFHRAMTGQGMPEVGARNPQPYGHMAQRLHQMNAQRVSGAGWDPLNNPKPASFVENLVGNQQPVTVDTHAFRLPAILAQDPRFLETAFQVDKTAPKQNIAQMVARGELPMEEAARRPAYWQAQPKDNEYAAMERYYKGLGQDLGLTPAQTQAAAWVGGGKLTGLKSDESKPFLQFFEDRIYKTAIEKNMDPQDVLRAFVRGQMPLYASGGSVTDNAIDTAKRIAKKSANIKEPA